MLWIFSQLSALYRLFPDPVCPRCHNLQEGGRLCCTCLDALEAAPSWSVVRGVETLSLFTWNRRIKRLWYGVKFYQHYRAILLFEQALDQLLGNSIDGDIWVVHPPFRKGRPNLFAPMLQFFCRRRGWKYLPKALVYPDSEAPLLTQSQHEKRSKTERLEGAQTRFDLHESFLGRVSKEDWPDRVVIFDDILTTGATLSACKTRLQDAFCCSERLSATLVQPHIQGLVLMVTPHTQAFLPATDLLSEG